MNALALAEINALSLSLVTPSLLSSVKALQMIAGDVGVDYSHDPLDHDSGAEDARDDHALPITSESSVASSREENIDIVQDGLAFQIADFNADAGSQRLDYVITQVDVSRMARVASRDLHAEGVHQPPSKYPADCSLILSSHEEEEQDVDDFLQTLTAQGLMTQGEAGEILEEIEDHVQVVAECQKEVHEGEYTSSEKISLMRIFARFASMDVEPDRATLNAVKRVEDASGDMEEYAEEQA